MRLSSILNSAAHTVSVVGHGVISGARYKWHGGNPADSLRAVDLVWTVPMHLNGPTIVDSKGHCLILPPNSSAHAIKVIGWLFNEDGIWLTSFSSLRNSFIRTNDDSVRLYSGAGTSLAVSLPLHVPLSFLCLCFCVSLPLFLCL